MLIGYARVSTTDQTTEPQFDALTRAGCEKIFRENASGARADRVELIKAIAACKEGDTLIVWKLDRLARSMKQLIDITGQLDRAGVGFRSLTEAIDTTTPGGKLVFHIFGALAEFERSLIRERTMAGLEYARDQGRFGGRPYAMTAQQLERAKQMILDGQLSYSRIAWKCGISVNTLRARFPGGRIATQARQIMEDAARIEETFSELLEQSQ